MTFTWPTASSTSFRQFPFLIDISYPLQAPIPVTSVSSPPLHPSRSIKRPSYASFCTQYCTSRAFLRSPTITITTDIYFFRVPVSPCQAQLVPFRENVARLTRFTLTNYNHIFPKVQHSTVTELTYRDTGSSLSEHQGAWATRRNLADAAADHGLLWSCRGKWRLW